MALHHLCDAAEVLSEVYFPGGVMRYRQAEAEPEMNQVLEAIKVTAIELIRDDGEVYIPRNVLGAVDTAIEDAVLGNSWSDFVEELTHRVQQAREAGPYG